jgi:hypothetical protein
MILHHIHKITLPHLLIMEKTRIETTTIHIYPVTPRSRDRRSRNDIIMRIFETAVFALYICVGDVEFSLGVGEGEAGGPDAAGIGDAPQVEEGGGGEGTGRG